MRIESIKSYANYFYEFTPSKNHSRDLIFDDAPTFLDAYFAASSMLTLFTMELPFTYRVLANVGISCFSRGLDLFFSKKNFDGDFAIDLVSHVGAIVLIGELESKALVLMGKK